MIVENKYKEKIKDFESYAVCKFEFSFNLNTYCIRNNIKSNYFYFMIFLRIRLLYFSTKNFKIIKKISFEKFDLVTI